MRFPNSSSYLCSTGRTFWAFDPAYVPNPPWDADEFAAFCSGLEQCDFIVVSHCHADHCSIPLLQHLQAKGRTRIIIPAAIAPQVTEYAALPRSVFTILEAGDSITIEGITITVYPGYHDEPERGVNYPSGSFLITLPDGLNLYFPVDVRDYQQQPPVGLPPIDFEFGHLWLGRGISDGDNFPLLDDFCHFMLRAKPQHLFLTHLCEVSRAADSMWLPRHARLVAQRLAQLAPELKVWVPHHGAAMTLDKPFTGDRYATWETTQQREFDDHLGVSLYFGGWPENLAQVRSAGIKAIEWCGLPPADEIPLLQRELQAWRATGGHALSLHLPEFNEEPERLERHRLACDVALQLGVDRVTQHIPLCSVADYRKAPQRVVALYLATLQPLIEGGVTIGIENMHMTTREPHDERRRFGYLPDECRDFIERLRQQSGYDRFGFHFDIGHAANNYPFNESYPPQLWFDELGAQINGMHLHQFEAWPCEAQPFPSGHHHISARGSGYPLLAPLYDAWQRRLFRAPLHLEIRRGAEGSPFASLQRLRQLHP